VIKIHSFPNVTGKASAIRYINTFHCFKDLQEERSPTVHGKDGKRRNDT